MHKTPVATSAAPSAIGAYSQAVSVAAASRMVFLSGQIGLDPATGALVEGGVEAEAECALRNLAAVLGASGLGLEHVVRATLYLTDMEDFARVDALYAARFPGVAPARVAIGVAALPRGARFEIDAIACA